MGVRWIVNAVLLALPVGTTVGILVGVDSHRQATGQAPLFNGEDGSGGFGGGSGGGSATDNRVTETRYCDKQVGISPVSKGSRYVLNPNQWGWTEGTPGVMCMNVTAFHNGTYATPKAAPEFSVTWQYPPGPESQPVHAFPNVQVDNQVVPVKLSTMQNVSLDLLWTYGIGNEPVATTNEAVLLQNLVNTNVAIDMFLDADQDNAQNASKAAYEVMVWFARFGAAAQPIGLKEGILSTQIVNTTTFNLYAGKNGLQQTVLTWVSSVTTEAFTGDIGPLISKLSTVAGAPAFPATSLYIGHLGLGSEAFSSSVNVTFSMPKLSIDVVKAAS